MPTRVQHPGEVLKQKLVQLGVAPSSLAHQISVPAKPDQSNHRRQAFRNRRHCSTFWPLVRSLS